MDTSLFKAMMCAVPALICSVHAGETADSAKTAKELAPVWGLVERIAPQAKEQVLFEIDPSFKGFSFSAKDGKTLIKANSVNNLAAAFGYALRHLGHANFSWNGNRIPANLKLTPPEQELKIADEFLWRFAYNYCTASYTYAFWNQADWRKEIDRLALNGFTHALIQPGLEKVWQLTLRELGYPEEKIKEFIPNPAAAAWWNMGNLEGHSGPISQDVIDREAELGRYIATQMRSLGMQPVLASFVGLVPHDLGDYYKKGDARYIDQGTWVSDIFKRPAVLDPTTQAFQDVAAIWYKNLHKVYGGASNAYGGDLFHEGGNAQGIDITAAAKAVQTARLKAAPDSTWFVQAWSGNPTKALLDGLDRDKVLVVALVRDMKNGHGSASLNYFNTPWIWGELQNFGGNQNLYGSLDVVGSLGKWGSSSEKDNFVGYGLLSEGTETNPMFYEMFFQRFWMPKDKVMTPAEIDTWVTDYLTNRYGSAPQELIDAITAMRASLYNPQWEQEGCTESILCARPGRNVQKASSWSSGKIYYDLTYVQKAANLYLEAAKKNPALLKEETFRYDFVDIIRQFLADTARPLLAATIQAYDTDNKEAFKKNAAHFIGLLRATDALLATDSNWRFGTWYERALAKGKTPEEKANMEMACKRLLTTWSGQIDALNDYANRQLAGLVKDYYLPRWELYFSTLGDALDGKIARDQVDATFYPKVHALELAFEKNKTPYTVQPEGNLLQIATKTMDTFNPVFDKLKPLIKQQAGHKWTLADGSKEFSFDVSDFILEPGTYVATFTWETGNDALEIEEVALYEGTKLIDKDTHPGWTGWEHKGNTYTLKVPELRKNLDTYTIKAKVKGAGNGINSFGRFNFQKKID